MSDKIVPLVPSRDTELWLAEFALQCYQVIKLNSTHTGGLLELSSEEDLERIESLLLEASRQARTGLIRYSQYSWLKYYYDAVCAVYTSLRLYNLPGWDTARLREKIRRCTPEGCWYTRFVELT